MYVTESNDSNFSRDSISDFIEDNANYDIDSSASTLLINMHNQSPNACMPKENFNALSPEVRQFCSKIPNDMKILIGARSAPLNLVHL